MEIQLPQDIDLKEVLAIRKFAYLPVITVITLITVMGAVILPNLRKVSGLRREVAVSRGELASLQEKATTLEGLDEDTLSQQIAILGQALPSDKNVFALLQSLSGLAAEKGVSLEGFEIAPGSIATETATSSSFSQEEREPRQDVRQQNLETLTASFTLAGEMTRITEYLSGVETLRPLLKFTNLKLSPLVRRSAVPATESSFPVSVDVELDFFYAPLPEHLGSIADPIVLISEKEQALYESLTSFLAYEAEIPNDLVVGKEDLFSSF